MTSRMVRREFLRGLAVAMGALTLSACAPQATPTPQPKPAAAPTTVPATAAAAKPAPKSAVTVTYWSSFGGKIGETEAALVKKFNESQSEVVLEYQFQGSYEETAQKLTAAIQAKTVPDVCLLSDVWWFKFYFNRAIVALDDLLSAQKVDMKDYQDSLINEGLRKGKHYWMPFARSTPLFYYNKEQWKAAGLPDRGPETWQEFGEWAPKLTKKEGGQIKVAAFAHPNGASYIAWLFQGVVWQFGGKYSDPDFTMHLTNPETIRAGQFYADTVHKMGWAVPSKDIGVDFTNGLCAATMASTGSMTGIKAAAKFEFGTAFLPKEKNFGCCTGGSGLAILQAAPEDKKRAAIKWVDFATNTENTAFFSQGTGYMPVRKSALGSAAMTKFFTEFPQFKTATEQLAKTQPQDAARVFVPNGDQIIGKGLERITVQTDAVATAFGDVQKTLENDAKPVIAAVKAVEG